MKYTKPQCIKIAPSPYAYSGYWDGLYRFHKGSYQEGGFFEVACNEEDMSNGNLEYFCEKGLTRQEVG